MRFGVGRASENRPPVRPWLGEVAVKAMMFYLFITIFVLAVLITGIAAYSAYFAKE